MRPLLVACLDAVTTLKALNHKLTRQSPNLKDRLKLSKVFLLLMTLCAACSEKTLLKRTSGENKMREIDTVFTFIGSLNAHPAWNCKTLHLYNIVYLMCLTYTQSKAI